MIQTEPHEEAKKDCARPAESKRMPTFARTRTITVERVCMGDELGLVRLVRELQRLDWTQHVQRVTGKVGSGTSLSHLKTQTKDIERLSALKVTEGHLSYWIIEENPNKEYNIKLDNLPEEVPTRAMEAYLSKYVINRNIRITSRPWGF